MPVRTASRRLHAAALLPALALLAAVGPLSAQEAAGEPPVLVGTVVDAASGTPVPGALVALPAEDRGVFADEQGRFSLRKLAPGRHTLVVAQLGYDSLVVVVPVEEGGAPVTLRLQADPVMLEGIQVVTDRIRRRRNAVATSVWAYDRKDLQLSSAFNVWEFVRSRTSLTPVRCVGGMSFESCAYVRGRPTPIVVYLDDSRMVGGLAVLESFRPQDLYLVEVYSGGRHIRLYTNWYIASSARRGMLPAPVLY